MFEELDKTISQDKELFCNIKKNDKISFTTLYKRYYQMVYSLSYRYTADTCLAEDVVQSVFVHFWENRDKINITTNVKNYLFTITKNYLLNQIQRNNLSIVSSYEALQNYNDTSLEDVEEKYKEERKLAFIHGSISTLPKKRREICLLKAYHGLSNNEIADRVGLSVSTVKKYYIESIDYLKYLTKKEYDEEHEIQRFR